MSKIILSENLADPATPASGKVSVFYRDDKILYTIDDTGAVTQLSNAALSTSLSDPAFIGAAQESIDVVITSSGSEVTATIEKQGGGEINIIFSDGIYLWDTDPAVSIVLTLGSDSAPVENFIYFLQSTKALTVSTASFPTSGEYLPIATVVVPSAATVLSDGTYKTHVWTDHLKGENNNGHIAHLNEWIRKQHATWLSGTDATINITPNGGGEDLVELGVASGVVQQLHDHVYPGDASPADVHYVNHPTTPYFNTSDLSDVLVDSNDDSLSNNRFNLVVWGVVSEDAIDSQVFINLPSGSYSTDSAALSDDAKLSNFNIPTIYKGTGFLIAMLTFRHRTISNGTWELLGTTDLRGSTPGNVSGSGTAQSGEFSDGTFTLFNAGDASKETVFDLSNVTTATQRTITMADKDVDLGAVVNKGLDETADKINLLDYGEVVNIIGSIGGGTQDIDLELGNVVSATVDTSPTTFTFSNPTATGNLSGFIFEITDGGSQTTIWPTSVDWAGGVAPTLTVAGVDILVFWTINAGTKYHGSVAILDSK